MTVRDRYQQPGHAVARRLVLEQRLALLETLVAGAPVGLAFVDANFRQVLVNDALIEMRESTRAEQMGLVAEIVPDQWPQLEPVYAGVLATGVAVVDVEVSATTGADPPTTRHWLTSHYPVRLRGKVIGIGLVVLDITDRKNAEQAHRRLAAIVEESGDAIFGSTLDGITTSWNAGAEELFGYTAQEMIGSSVAVLAPPDRLAEQAQMRARLASGGPAERHQTERLRKNGSRVDVLITASPALDEAGGVIGVSVIAGDITTRIGAVRDLEESQRRLAEAQQVAEIGSFELDVRTGVLTWSAERVRREAESRFEVAFEQAGIGAGIIGLDGIPIRVNAAVCELLGRRKELLVGRDWDAYHHPDELPIGPAMLARGHQGDSYSDERRFVRPDGGVEWAAFYGVLVRDDAGAPLYYLAQLQDITERKAAEAELAHQALHDSLTGLPNRALLADRLVPSLAGARRRGTQLGVIFLDLDNFKVVNDSLGHSAGDELLTNAVERIVAVVGPSDTVARFGGDEFVIVCDDAAVWQLETVGELVLEAVNESCVIAGREMTVTASAGIVVADDDSTPETLLRDSDAAMYSAKAHGRNRVEFFDEELRTTTERRLATASNLRRALERDEFTVHYQPVIDLDTPGHDWIRRDSRLRNRGRRTPLTRRRLSCPADRLGMAQRGQVRGVLFDVDGTLIDSGYVHAVCWWQALRKNGPMATIHPRGGWAPIGSCRTSWADSRTTIWCPNSPPPTTRCTRSTGRRCAACPAHRIW